MTGLYAGKDVALLTQHGKESLINPVLEPAVGCRILLAKGFDTDQLGSFAGDIKRIDSQLNTARTKARIGMNLLGKKIGLASEGAFVADPFGGLMPWNIELLIWLDDENQLEIVGMAQGPARNLQRGIRSTAELENFSREAGFPDHHLVLRPESPNDPRVRKGLNRRETLQVAFMDCLRESRNTWVYAEHDLRAFCNPTRQKLIQQAAADLLKKIQSCCPECSRPGFTMTGHLPGLPCRSCGHPTKLAKSFQWSCISCKHTREVANQERLGKPDWCDVCNP